VITTHVTDNAERPQRAASMPTSPLTPVRLSLGGGGASCISSSAASRTRAELSPLSDSPSRAWREHAKILRDHRPMSAPGLRTSYRHCSCQTALHEVRAMLVEAAAQCETLKVQLRDTRRREREQADTVRLLREELRMCRDDATQSLAAAQAQQAEEARRHEEELKRVRSAAQVISDELDRRRRSEGDAHARLESSEARCAVAEGRVSEAEAWRLARARESHELQVQVMQQQHEQQQLRAKVASAENELARRDQAEALHREEAARREVDALQP
jgi:hypothetical protein